MHDSGHVSTLKKNQGGDSMFAKTVEATEVARNNGPITSKHRTAHLLWSLVVWFFPAVLLLAGFIASKAFFPAFGDRVSWEPADPIVWLLLLISTIAAICWLLYDLFMVFNRETSSKTLQLNLFVSNLVALIFCAALGYLLNSENGISWWFLVPFIFAFIDTFTTGWAAINNATQKPFMTPAGTK